MDIKEFLEQTQSDVKAICSERLQESGGAYPYPEVIFAEVVTRHMAEEGMTFEPQVCHYEGRAGNARLKLTGYACSEDGEQLDLFVSLYEGAEEIQQVPDAETRSAAEQAIRFFEKSVDGTLLRSMDPSLDAYPLVQLIHDGHEAIEQVRLYILTDRQAKTKRFQSREVAGRTIKLEVMDIERLFRHWAAGKPRDEILLNFNELCGTPLPCVYVEGVDVDYDCALTALPGETLRFIYDRWGQRLLEANVRSFLSATGKVNKGIRDTLKDDPEHFMAFNNGIVMVADEVGTLASPDGASGIAWLKGVQIVNGGQTTASIYFAKKKQSDIDLSRVRVPAKIIILKTSDADVEESLIADISRYANSQNAVKQSDLSANKPFHIELEKLSSQVYCPDGVGRWFYERAAGSYNTMLAREGATPAKLKRLKSEIVPVARKITKTDLAKYLNTWDQLPHIASLGSQKNFERFMDTLQNEKEGGEVNLPDVRVFKEIVSKAIVFRKVNSLTRPMFPQAQGNVAIYTVALFANRIGRRVNWDRIWTAQDISPELREQLRIWSREVNDILHRTSGGKLISEWAKKPECWEAVRKASVSEPIEGVPELF